MADGDGAYSASWVRDFYDGYGEREWGRWDKTAADAVKLHVHETYLERYVSGNQAVLEVGAGAGRFTEKLARRGARVTVVDLSPVQLRLNKTRAREYGFAAAVEEWLELDMCEMGPLADGAFDVVVAYGGPLSHVFERFDEAMAEAERVMKPGGVFLASVMSLWGTAHDALPDVLELDPTVNGRITASGDLLPEVGQGGAMRCHMFRASELRQRLEALGWTVEAMAASNCMSGAWGETLDEVRHDEAAWSKNRRVELKDR